MTKETYTAMFRQAKIMQKLPDHCSVTNEVTDVRKLIRKSGSVHGVTIKDNACAHIVLLTIPMLNCIIQGMT